MKKILSTISLMLVSICLITSLACSNTQTNDGYVYVTNTGSSYHRAGCSYLSSSSNRMSLENAKKQGYTACSRCNPPRTISFNFINDNHDNENHDYMDDLDNCLLNFYSTCHHEGHSL